MVSENVLRLEQSFGKLVMVLELNLSLGIGLVPVKLWVHAVSVVGVAENLVLLVGNDRFVRQFVVKLL